MDLQDISIALKLSLLESDVVLMLKAYDNYAVNEIRPQIQNEHYNCPKELYEDIVTIVGIYNMTHELLEIMPFIDEYIENFFCRK